MDAGDREIASSWLIKESLHINNTTKERIL